MSNDSANRHSTVFHAVPLTSKIPKKTYLPTHIFISSFKAVGLRTNSIAQCEQLCDVKDTDLIEKIGKVSKNQLRQITKGMQIQLGMSTKHNNPISIIPAGAKAPVLHSRQHIWWLNLIGGIG